MEKRFLEKTLLHWRKRFSTRENASPLEKARLLSVYIFTLFVIVPLSLFRRSRTTSALGLEKLYLEWRTRLLEWRSVFSNEEAFSRVKKRLLGWSSVSSRKRFSTRENASPLEKMRLLSRKRFSSLCTFLTCCHSFLESPS